MLKRIATVALLALAAQAVAAAAATAPALDQGVVDINTNLGYEQAAAAGTGMVLTPSGEILTNNHVIRGSTTVRVVVPGTGHSYAGTVVGYSVANDVAVIQLKGASNLKTVTLGNSSAVKHGLAVTAVGNAEGVGGMPSEVTGTVTGLGKSITASDDDGTSEQLKGLIETDAPLEPGDSGGPLLNPAGQVVGMDTAASSGFAFQEQGANDAFTIPIDHALALAKQIVAGHASATVHVGPTPFLGVQLEQSRFSSSGLVVYSVVASSAAAKAGVAPNDMLTTIDGRSITTETVLTTFLLTKPPGTKISLGLVDPDGTRSTLTVTLGSGPPQ
jgi:S1-C subfamily serine protease